MCNQQTYKRAKKAIIDPLERNRAGAATNLAVQEIAQQLKEIHKYNFSGRDIHWNIWANAILAADAHLRESMMSDSPPGKIIELFTRAPANPETVVRDLQRNVSIGMSVNNTTKEAVKQVRQELDTMKQVIEQLTKMWVTLNARFELLENSVQTNDEMLGAIGTAARVVESEVSENAFDQIEYLDDPDHE